METEILVRWTKNGSRVSQNQNQPKYRSVNGCSDSTIRDLNCETIHRKPFSLSGSSDDEMIDITSGGESMDCHLEQSHASHSEPEQLKYYAMTELPDSSSDSDNEFTKLQASTGMNGIGLMASLSTFMDNDIL